MPRRLSRTDWARIDALRDEDIDLSDSPELGEEFFKRAKLVLPDMKIEVEKDAIIVLVGAMGTGKSTFAKKHFAAHDIVATDFIREQLTGDFQSQTANEAVFDILNATVLARAKMGIFTIIDSTGTNSVISHAHKTAHEYNRPLYAFIFPQLTEEELTSERMQHRMKVLHVYHNQVARIGRTVYPKDMKLVHIPASDVRVNVQVKILDTETLDEYDLPQEFKYIVLPDLHGYYKAVESILPLADDTKVVSLGDIVDRGPSSYKTFTLINNLRKEGKLYAVASNHDNKFYRWCKKYLKNLREPSAKVDVRTFGMKVAFGLDKTIDELYSLPKKERDQYVYDFMDYYESVKPILRLTRGNETHIFVHAGVTANVFNGKPFSEFDHSAFIYADQPMVEDVERILEESGAVSFGMNYVIHTGHNFGYYNHERSVFEISTTKSGRVTRVEHDVGLGKREDEVPLSFQIV